MHIAEVAKLAGVSTATVSRALSSPEKVNARTREHVLEVVRATGYTPNIAGRRLRAARSMTALVVVPSLITPFFSDLLLAIDQALSAKGYGLLIGNLHDEADKEAELVRLVLSGQADGAILLNGRMLRDGNRSMADSGAPIVGLSLPIADAAAPAVVVDEEAGGALVAEHLLALGHCRIAYLSGPPGNYCDVARWAGFARSLAAAGVDPTTVIRWQGDFHVESGVAAGRAFIEAADRPTAVFAASDMMAIGFMRSVHDAGLTVPEDVSIVGYDGIVFADFTEPPLTTVRQPREAMGRAAVELLLRLIENREPTVASAKVVRLPVALRLARSSAAPRLGRSRHRSAAGGRSSACPDAGRA
jgi:LacI family repressor for deo operon, udp, cdd, tsx, nupC, and nupG